MVLDPYIAPYIDPYMAYMPNPAPNQVQLQMTTPFLVTLPACQLPADYANRSIQAKAWLACFT